MNWPQFLYKSIRRNFSTKATALVMAVLIYVLVYGMIINVYTISFSLVLSSFQSEKANRIVINEPEGLLCFFPADSQEMSAADTEIRILFEGPNNRIRELRGKPEIIGICRIPEDILQGQNERVIRVGIDRSKGNPDVVIEFDKLEDLTKEMDPYTFSIRVVKKDERRGLPPAIDYEGIQKAAAPGMVVDREILFEPSKLTVTGPPIINALTKVDLKPVNLPDNLTGDQTIDLAPVEELGAKRITVKEKPIRAKIRVAPRNIEKPLEVMVSILLPYPIPKGLNVRIPKEAEEKAEIKVVGPEDKVRKISGSNIWAFVDLNDLGEDRSLGSIPIYFHLKGDISGVAIEPVTKSVTVEKTITEEE